MSMLFAYMAGGEGVGVEVLKYFVRGARIFSTYFVCVCGGGGGGRRDQVHYLSFREKKLPTPPINK